jgi:hypothetical protein
MAGIGGCFLLALSPFACFLEESLWVWSDAT